MDPWADRDNPDMHFLRKAISEIPTGEFMV